MPLFGLAVPLIDDQGRVIGALSAAVNLGIQVSRSDYRVALRQDRRLRAHRPAATPHRHRDRQNAGRGAAPGPGVIPLLDRVIDGFEGRGWRSTRKASKCWRPVKRVPSPTGSWSRCCRRKRRFAPIRETQRRMLLATIVLTLVAGLLTFWWLRHQLSPLHGCERTREHARR